MNPPELDAVVVDPPGEVRCVVVWLHGLGADGYDFKPIIPALEIPPSLGVRFVFPHAPAIPVTINGGFVMPAWYDIRDADLDRREDREGHLQSVRAVEALIARETCPSSRIVVAGFSQGGAVAAQLALCYPKPLAGLLALSTYLVAPDGLADQRASVNESLPIFYGHGERDPVVPISRGRLAYQTLKDLGYNVTWKSYPMEHEVCPEEIQDVGAFLRSVLSISGS